MEARRFYNEACADIDVGDLCSAHNTFPQNRTFDAYMSQTTQTADSWCDPDLASFDADTPLGIRTRSRQCASVFAPNINALTQLRAIGSFVSPVLWGIYWSIARSASKVCWEGWDSLGENGLTNVFVSALKDAVEEANGLLDEDAQLVLATSAILDHKIPAVKEAKVGADLLVLIDTNDGELPGFSPAPAIRLFWLQAKSLDPEVIKTNTIFTLDYSRENSHGRQVDALKKVHAPERGSFGFYAQYARQIDFVPVVSVDKLSSAAAGNFEADLQAEGTRFQEWLVSRLKTTAQNAAFANFDEVKAFLDACSGDLPFVIVTIAARKGPAAELILQRLKSYYKKQVDSLLSELKKSGKARVDFDVPEESEAALSQGDSPGNDSRPAVDPGDGSEPDTTSTARGKRLGFGKK